MIAMVDYGRFDNAGGGCWGGSLSKSDLLGREEARGKE